MDEMIEKTKLLPQLQHLQRRLQAAHAQGGPDSGPPLVIFLNP